MGQWKDREISAYLDGYLDARRAAALEEAMAHDAELRHRVQEMRTVATLVREMPLRDPPRDFLVTPSMVGEARPRRSFAPSLPVPRLLRAATALSALLFIISLGLYLWGNTARFATAPLYESTQLPEPRVALTREVALRLEAEKQAEAPAQEAQAPSPPQVEREETEAADEGTQPLVGSLALPIEGTTSPVPTPGSEESAYTKLAPIPAEAGSPLPLPPPPVPTATATPPPPPPQRAGLSLPLFIPILLGGATLLLIAFTLYHLARRR